jgi:hypothetical protein
MTKTVAEKLSDLVKAVKELPDEMQEALVDEFSERVSDAGRPHLTQEQVAEVKRRLAMPRRYATDDEVQAILSRYKRGQ